MKFWRRGGKLRWVAAFAALALISLVSADFIVERTLANVELPDEVALPASAQVFDRSGRLIATYRDEITRFVIDTSDLPDRVKNAVISAEDRDFYEHEGVSLSGIARAAWRNVRSGEVEEGGSTITQQYVKNAILKDTDRTLARKMREALLAIKLEREFTKDEILERYLNAVYFGRGAYGIEAAARVYFGKHAEQLSLSQAAFLAGIIPAPEKYQPDAETGSEVAIERRNRVLAAMRAEGYITAADEERASSNEIRLKTSPEVRQKHQPAAYFLEWLRKEYLYPRFGDCLYTCGLRIYTTLDMDAQRAAEDAVDAALNEKGDPQAALVSMTRRGKVRAMIGGRHYTNIKRARGFNYATDGVRQAGSAFKPFTLLAAIEKDISPYSYFSGHSPKTIDSPFCSNGIEPWTPENYGGASYGTLRLEDATRNSVNTVYAELIAEIGPAAVADLLQRFGFRAPTEDGEIAPNCSLSLGTLDVSVLQMARAYAGLAARGRLPEVVPVERVENREGECLLGFGTPKKHCEERVDVSGEQVIEEHWVDVLTRSLTGVVSYGTGTAAQIGRPVAGKTGTTQDSRDAWFAGYIPQMATVVWMGYPVDSGKDKILGTRDDVSPLMSYCSDTARCRPVHGIEVTGGSFPATIWHDFMAAAIEKIDLVFFTEPAIEPSQILNPPPPPKEKKKKGKDKDKDKDDDDDDD